MLMKRVTPRTRFLIKNMKDLFISSPRQTLFSSFKKWKWIIGGACLFFKYVSRLYRNIAILYPIKPKKWLCSGALYQMDALEPNKTFMGVEGILKFFQSEMWTAGDSDSRRRWILQETQRLRPHILSRVKRRFCSDDGARMCEVALVKMRFNV